MRNLVRALRVCVPSGVCYPEEETKGTLDLKVRPVSLLFGIAEPYL